MKKQLLSIFLTFTVISCFATQPTNTELLVHLKQVKTVIKKDLQEVFCSEKNLQQKLGQDYVIITESLNNFFNITELTKEYSKIEKIWFYHVCHELKPINSYFDLVQLSDDEKDKQILANLNMDDFDTKRLEPTKAKELSSILNTLLEQYHYEDVLELNYLIINTKILTALLQDIDNKIKELSLPFEALAK